MIVRTQTAAPAEKEFRKLLRMYVPYGCRVEAVSWVRGQDNEHTVVVCWPGREAGDVVRLFAMKENNSVQVNRIHIGRETYPGQPPAVRVYLRWSTDEEMQALKG